MSGSPGPRVPGKSPTVESTSACESPARSRGRSEAGLGPPVQLRARPELEADERVTRGARQAIELASAPLRARWLVAFRLVRRRLRTPNRTQKVRCRATRSHSASRTATESVEMANSARGVVVRLACPCSVERLQKSAGGAGPRTLLSVVAESGKKGIARSGDPATGERASRA